MALILRPPGESPPLPDRLRDLAAVRRAVAVAAGLFAFAAVVVGPVAVFCFLDAWLHLPPLVRGFALVGTLAAAGVVWARGVAAAVRLRTDPLAVALELEDRFPKLNDALASAVSFLRAERPDRLRMAAVARAERLAERHDFRQIVPSAHAWRMFWAAAATLAAAALLAAVSPERAARAAVRLADPFGDHPWPRATAVDILAPDPLPARVARGEPFELRFAVRGVRPEQAEVRFRLGAEEFARTVPVPPADPNAEEDPPATAKFDPGLLPRDFLFRVTANDADTGWQRVEVAPPPKLVPLDGRPSPQVALDFPAYTGLPPAVLPDGTGVIEAPFGTRVRLRAAADVRLSAAVLAYLGDRSAADAAPLAAVGPRHPLAAVAAGLLADAVSRDVPVPVSADGRVLDLDFVPNTPGLYALRFTDESGLTGTRLVEFRLQADPAPAVALARPAPGSDPAVYAPDAAVPVEAAADDRLYGLRRVALEYRVNRDGPFRDLPLADARGADVTVPAAAGGWVAGVRPEHLDVRRPVPVAAFLRPDGGPVRDGDVVTVRAAADDWDDVSVLKPPGRSGEVEFRVASREGIEAFLQKELAALRPELLRLRDQQRDARQQAADAAPRPGEPVGPQDREKLMTAEQTQRAVRGKVADPRDGLRAKADQLRATVRDNGLPKSPTAARAEAAAEELGRLADRDLPAAEPLLGEARQQAARPPAADQGPKLADLIARAGRHQQAAEDGLSELLERLEQWGGAGEVRGEARGLRDAVGREAGPPPAPAGRPPEALPPAQRAALERAAARLDGQAERAGQLLGKAGRVAAEKDKKAAADRAAADAKQAEADALRRKAGEQPPGSDAEHALRRKAAAAQAEADGLKLAADRAKAEAEALRRGVEAAGGQAVADDLRRAADAARGNRPGEAAAAQTSAAGRLDRMADALAEKPPPAADELAKKKKAADDLDQLAADQDELRKKVDAANALPDPAEREAALQKLAREQDRLREQARELAHRLTRDRADDAARDVRQAGDRMEAARDDLAQGKTPDQPPDEARDRLDRARDKLDREAADDARSLSDEARRKLAAQVTALRDRQAAADAEAGRIQDAVLKAKAWDRAVLASLGDLEDREKGLAGEVRTLGEKQFDRLPVFARLLADAADAMEKAAAKAADRKDDVLNADPAAAFDPELEAVADGRVRRPMKTALRRLDQLLDALKPPDPKEQAKADDGPPQPGGAAGGGNADVVPPLAQLKVLRALQAELNDRTAAFAKANPDPDKLTDDQQDELKELERAQRDVAALFEKLAPAFQPPPPEGNP